MTTPRDLATPLSRITWRDGQTLASRDLREDQRYADQLRYLHIRYQHKTWGVVEGLGVFSSGGSAVEVVPGYALDIEGRELLLPAFTRVAAPANVAASTTMYLVISQSPGARACAAPLDLSTLCPGVKNPLPVETGTLSWKTVTQVRPGLDVLLARVLIAGGKLASSVDTSVQRAARSMAQPKIWSDSTQQGSTGWTDFMRTPLQSIRATVDASNGGFLSTPAYFPRLAGTSQPAIAYIEWVGPSAFAFVVQPVPIGSSPVPDAAKAEELGWNIEWLAIELQSAALLFPFSKLKGKLP
jgi:hypothetical protein